MAPDRPTGPDQETPATAAEPAPTSRELDPQPPADAGDGGRAERRRQREANRAHAHERPQAGMLPARERRRTRVERGTMRLVATGGIVGIATLLGAILVGQDVDGWITGLVIGVVSLVLAAVLWSSRQL
ncbi:MAG TPA: hypothetical protein VGM91_13740 [Conexibacter sp.]|jgi:hypothetical protein